jgi:hypothetical protein
MGHIGKPPAVSDLTHRPMCLRPVLQRPAGTFKVPRLNQTHNRRFVLSEHVIGVSHADAGDGGHSPGVERRVGQSRLDRGAHAHEGKRARG